jgi:hypothetical protein
MSSLELNTRSAAVSRGWVIWAARAFAALPVLLILMSAGMKLSHSPNFVAMFVGHLGYPEATLTGIGLLELACALLYAVPQTSVLGALLLTAYFGGATATHVRIGEPFAMPVLFGVLVWLGLIVRDARVRQFLIGTRKAS